MKLMRHLILDVDGVLTTGQFLYTSEGKYAKVFGPHDNDGIKLLQPHMAIQAVSADHRGFPITKKRVADDMGLALDLVPETKRLAWLEERFDLSECVYMGDGMHDAEIFGRVGYSIAPASAFYTAKEKASFVTGARAAEGAVAEACLHLLEKFFTPAPTL